MMSIDKLTNMENDLKDFMLKYSEDEEDALHAASVLMKCAMFFYAQLLNPDDIRELLETVGDSVDDIVAITDGWQEEEDEDDPFAGIDTEVKH